MLIRVAVLKLCLSVLALVVSGVHVRADQGGHRCPEGVDQLVRSLYRDDVRSVFWEEDISRAKHFFDENLFDKLLEVYAGNLSMRSQGYGLVDVDIFSGTQWGADAIQSLACDASGHDQFKVDLVILAGGPRRQFEHSIVVFVKQVFLGQDHWRVSDIASYEDSSHPDGYGYLLSRALGEWIGRAEVSR